MFKSEEFINLDFNFRTKDEMKGRSGEFYELMKKRRTVREISSEPIPDKVINNILLTAGTAPSGANKQPWFFAVVKDQKLKQKIRKECEAIESFNYQEKYKGEWRQELDKMKTTSHKPYLEEAPALIVVFKQRYGEQNGEKVKHYYISESVGISLGFLFASIHNAGLVTIPYTPMPRAFLNDLLDRPSYESAVMVMPIGYPKDNVKVPDKYYKTLDEISKVY